MGDRCHGFADPFLDALGDHDFAFAGQQFHRAHLAHVHAHRVGRASGLRFDRGQRGNGFVRDVVGAGVAAGEQQRLGIRCLLEHLDTHVIDHLDDLFHLVRVGNILRQVIVHLGVGQIILFLALGDEILEA